MRGAWLLSGAVLFLLCGSGGGGVWAVAAVAAADDGMETTVEAVLGLAGTVDEAYEQTLLLEKPKDGARLPCTFDVGRLAGPPPMPPPMPPRC